MGGSKGIEFPLIPGHAALMHSMNSIQILRTSLLLAGTMALSTHPAFSQKSGADEDLLTGSGGSQGSPRPSEQGKEPGKGQSYFSSDGAGAGRPRLFGESLLGDYRIGESVIKIGGYVDLEFRNMQDGDPTFRAHRLVPLIEARISNRIRFQTEIEIEDGSDISVEFAHIDYRLMSSLQLRAGIVLLPLGRLNLLHDSPMLELTDRPLVNTKVIPTTLRDTGFGFTGEFSEVFGEGSDLMTYEIYVISGYRGEKKDSSGYVLDRQNGLRNARASKSGVSSGGYSPYENSNGNLAFQGRLAFKGAGYEFGLSGYYGAWDNKGDLSLGQAVLDFEWTPAAIASLQDSWVSDFKILGEGALSRIERDAAATAGGVPGKANGFYSQLQYHIPFPESWIKGEDPIVSSDGGFNLVYRYGQIDLGGARSDRHALGFTFRPNGDRTVFKLEYQWNGEGGSNPVKANNGFVASVATYF